MIYLTLFLEFFKIGLFTIGGGYAMLPMIQQVMERYQWISDQDFVDMIAVSESTPGPFAINIATFVGNTQGGFFGAVCSTVGVVLPSFLIILLIAKFFTNFKDHMLVQGAMTGLRPVVVGLIASALLSLVITALFPVVNTASIAAFFAQIDLKAVIIMAIGLTVSLLWKWHPIVIILISAALGIVFYGFL